MQAQGKEQGNGNFSREISPCFVCVFAFRQFTRVLGCACAYVCVVLSIACVVVNIVYCILFDSLAFHGLGRQTQFYIWFGYLCVQESPLRKPRRHVFGTESYCFVRNFFSARCPDVGMGPNQFSGTWTPRLLLSTQRFSMCSLEFLSAFFFVFCFFARSVVLEIYRFIMLEI